MKKKFKTFVLMLIGLISLSLHQSCLEDKLEDLQDTGEYNNEQEQKATYDGFTFETVDEYQIEISAVDNFDIPLKGAYLELYTDYPLDEAGLLNSDARNSQVFKGITNSEGILTCAINPPATEDSLHILNYYIGLESTVSVALDNEFIQVRFGSNLNNKSAVTTDRLKSVTVPTPTIVNGYYTLGTWDANGVPNYLETENDIISAGFLDDVNASLPERAPLPETHPEYLSNTDDANLNLVEDCEIWVTFVHEGAGWQNALGYYTYPTDNPPANVNEISDPTLIFPNLSIFSGGLSPGNKVQLYYLDPETSEYSERFPAGYSVGWFLVAQGWSGNNQNVGQGVYKHYSNVNLNVESDPELQKHNVILFDGLRQLLLTGFEDIRRDATGCDQDFNDAIFYTSLTPFNAIDRTDYQVIDSPTDSDGDGVVNTIDDFPYDANNSFNNFYPSENTYATLVFEDMWPSRGDYDFNDLVVDYNYNQVTNAENKIVALRAKILVKAIGASFHNALGIVLNTPPDNVNYVAGQLNTKGFLSLASNGTENGQSDAVIMFFDDAFNVLPYPGSGIGVNTFPEYPYVTPTVQEVDIVFNDPIDFNTLGTPPYNPFIIVNRIRGREVHLPNMPPTDLADPNLFGTADDNSNLSRNEYYISDGYLPWAINLPVSFSYPIEKKGIMNSHLKFDTWAISGGFNYMDWYEDKTGYRNHNNIYSH